MGENTESNFDLLRPEEQVELAEDYFAGKGVQRSFRTAVELYKKAAGSGNVTAAIKLGCLYFEGTHVKQDQAEAFRLLKRAEEQEELPAPAVNYLGECYEHGYGTDIDLDKALDKYEKAAVMNSGKAYMNLGRCYELGISVEKNEREAFVCYERAEGLSEAESAHTLARCCEHGIGTEIDAKKAAAFYAKGARSNHPPSQKALGRCYELGIGVAKNKNTSLNWYTKAAKGGDVDAQIKVASSLVASSANGKPENIATAMEWYEKAALQGSEEGMEGLRQCRSDLGTEEAAAKAFHAFEAAMTKGFSAVIHLLAESYKEGYGTEKDLKKAFELYEKGAQVEQNSLCQFNYAVCLEMGEGTEKNIEKAIEWYEKASSNGDEDAGYRIGCLILNGLVQGRTQQQGLDLVSESADKESEDALCEMGVRFMTGIREGEEIILPVDYNKAVKCFRACRDHPRALGCYGYCFETGKGEKRNVEKAIKLYERAAATKEDAHLSQFACYRLGVCYETGTGVAPSLSEALSYYNRSLEYVEKDPTEGWPGLRDAVHDGQRRVLLSLFKPAASVKDVCHSLLGKRKQREGEDEGSDMASAQSRRRTSLKQAVEVAIEGISRGSTDATQKRENTAKSEINLYCYNALVVSHGLRSGDVQMREAANKSLHYILHNAERMKTVAEATLADIKSSMSRREGEGARIELKALASPSDSLLAHYVVEELNVEVADRDNIKKKLSALSPESGNYLRDVVSLFLEESLRMSVDIASLPPPLLESLFSLPAREGERMQAEMERCRSYLARKKDDLNVQQLEAFVGGKTSAMSSDEKEVYAATKAYVSMPPCPTSAWKCELDSIWKEINQQYRDCMGALSCLSPKQLLSYMRTSSVPTSSPSHM